METALIEHHSIPAAQIASADGTFVRRSAIAAALAFSVLTTALLVAAPELRGLAPIAFLWALVVAGAVATYAIGARMRRSTHLP